MKNAVEQEGIAPNIVHSDQGSEYRSQLYREILDSYGIEISMSPKASPWRNGFQESYYRGFKEDLGNINQFSCPGELFEAIAHTVDYYDNSRIHSAIKAPPAEFVASSNFLTKITRG